MVGIFAIKGNYMEYVNKELENIDPYSSGLTNEQKKAIAAECEVNPVYFWHLCQELEVPNNREVELMKHFSEIIKAIAPAILACQNGTVEIKMGLEPYEVTWMTFSTNTAPISNIAIKNLLNESTCTLNINPNKINITTPTGKLELDFNLVKDGLEKALELAVDVTKNSGKEAAPE